MITRPLRIQVDFNGVIRNPEPVRELIVQNKFNKVISGSLLKRKVVMREGLLTETEFNTLIHLACQEPYRLMGSPHVGARKGIVRLLQRGHSVDIVTASDPDAFQACIDWLKKKRFPEHPRLQLLSPGKDGQKSSVKGVPDVVLDDDRHHLRDAYQAFFRGAGTTPIPRKSLYLFLFTRRYNRDLEIDEWIQRISGWKAFVREVEHISRARPVLLGGGPEPERHN